MLEESGPKSRILIHCREATKDVQSTHAERATFGLQDKVNTQIRLHKPAGQSQSNVNASTFLNSSSLASFQARTDAPALCHV